MSLDELILGMGWFALLTGLVVTLAGACASNASLRNLWRSTDDSRRDYPLRRVIESFGVNGIRLFVLGTGLLMVIIGVLAILEG